jgi:hypothetical protein
MGVPCSESEAPAVTAGGLHGGAAGPQGGGELLPARQRACCDAPAWTAAGSVRVSLRGDSERPRPYDPAGSSPRRRLKIGGDSTFGKLTGHPAGGIEQEGSSRRALRARRARART